MKNIQQSVRIKQNYTSDTSEITQNNISKASSLSAFNTLGYVSESFGKLTQFLTMPTKHCQKNYGGLKQENFRVTIPKLSIQSFVELYREMCLRIKKLINLRKNWSKDEIIIMLWLVDKYIGYNGYESQVQLTQEDWKKLAPLFFGRTPRDYMFKFLSLKKHNLTKNPWTEIEQSILKELIKQKGEKWQQISKQMYLTNPMGIFRTGKQCRQHWICFMDPNLKKGYWSQSEDQKLLDIFFKVGKKWSMITHFLNGRNENSIKNRFVILMEKYKIRDQKLEFQDTHQKFQQKMDKINANKKEKNLCVQQKQSSIHIFSQKQIKMSNLNTEEGFSSEGHNLKYFEDVGNFLDLSKKNNFPLFQ